MAQIQDDFLKLSEQEEGIIDIQLYLLCTNTQDDLQELMQSYLIDSPLSIITEIKNQLEELARHR